MMDQGILYPSGQPFYNRHVQEHYPNAAEKQVKTLMK